VPTSNAGRNFKWRRGRRRRRRGRPRIIRKAYLFLAKILLLHERVKTTSISVSYFSSIFWKKRKNKKVQSEIFQEREHFRTW
jgi:hypothetical protein